MPHRVRTGLVVGALLVTVGLGPAGAQQTSTILSAYDAWVSGRVDVIGSTFPTAQAFTDARRDLQAALRLWIRSWKPSQAAFLLELSLVAYDRQWPEAPELLAGTRNLIVRRPSAPGTNPGEDEFELAFHRAAITFFLSRQMLREADAYLTALAGRVDLVPSTTGQPRLVDPWMTFARAMVSEIATSPGLRSGSRSSGVESALSIPLADSGGRRQAELAITAFSRLGDVPEVAAEAAVRRGLLLLRIERVQEALAAFDEADAAAPDDTVRYWTALFRGRALEAAGRPEDAAAAYERAAAVAPAAQSPAVALASLWQRHDRPAQALEWARRAMNTPAGSVDPWWLYWRGDIRHSGERLAAIRRATP